MIVDSHKYVNYEIIKNPYTVVLRLTVKALEKRDFTTFACNAQNSLGEAEGVIMLFG